MAGENVGLDLASQTGQNSIADAISDISESGLATKEGQADIADSIADLKNSIVSLLNLLTLETNTVPTGTVIYFAGQSAPDGYLSCDGTVYTINEYPDLSEFIETNYGTLNYFGGDGVLTFAVPDWRGEFFRAAGNNSRLNQGNGGSVGQHQDQTLQNRIAVNKTNNEFQLQGNTSGWLSIDNADFEEKSNSHYWMNVIASNSGLDTNAAQRYASRPTNTSLLVCIKT